MRTAWIAIACAEHVRRGREGGFMQVCHGKASPLHRLQPGDGIVYYSPTLSFGSKLPYRAFSAVGIVAEGEPLTTHQFQRQMVDGHTRGVMKARLQTG